MSSKFAQEKFYFSLKKIWTVEKSYKVNCLEMEGGLQQILGTKFSYFAK